LNAAKPKKTPRRCASNTRLRSAQSGKQTTENPRRPKPKSQSWPEHQRHGLDCTIGRGFLASRTLQLLERRHMFRCNLCRSEYRARAAHAPIQVFATHEGFSEESTPFVVDEPMHAAATRCRDSPSFQISP
jgi:hypothetical protein